MCCVCVSVCVCEVMGIRVMGLAHGPFAVARLGLPHLRCAALHFMISRWILSIFMIYMVPFVYQLTRYMELHLGPRILGVTMHFVCKECKLHN